MQGYLHLCSLEVKKTIFLMMRLRSYYFDLSMNFFPFSVIRRKAISHDLLKATFPFSAQEEQIRPEFFYLLVLGTFGVKHRVGEGNKNEMRKMLQSE